VAELAWDTLSTSRTAMEQECAKMHAGMDTLEQEKTMIAADNEARLAATEKKFHNYQTSHRRKLHDLRAELEGAMNEIGVRCLPYPEKGSAIGVITTWFTQEIQALPDAIAKANKNLLVYCLICVLKMLQEHMCCFHVAGLEAIMTACDASIFDNVPADILKISAHIVMKWWSCYGVPYVTEVSHVRPEVKFFDSELAFLIRCCLLLVVIWCRKRMMAGVRLRLLRLIVAEVGRLRKR
jgi:hypothetical protein